MAVRSHGMQVFGVSQPQKNHNVVTNFHHQKGSVSQLQFLGRFVESPHRKKEQNTKKYLKGILKNATSMPDLAQNGPSDHHKIDHKQLKNVIKRQKRLSKVPGADNEKKTKKTVKFNDPVGRLSDLEYKYKMCSRETNNDDSSLRKHKQIQQISLRNAQSENKSDNSNVLITVVYDLKLKDNLLITPNNCETTAMSSNDKPTQDVLETSSEDCSHECVDGRLQPSKGDHRKNHDTHPVGTFLSHTVIAPTCLSSKKSITIDNDNLCQNKTPSENPLHHRELKPRDHVVVTRARAKPVMFSRCVSNTIQTVDEPKLETTNFCNDEKTSEIMRWLNDVKYEQERDGFCTLLISDGETMY